VSGKKQDLTPKPWVSGKKQDLTPKPSMLSRGWVAKSKTWPLSRVWPLSRGWVR